jgi:hypothetical protein
VYITALAGPKCVYISMRASIQITILEEDKIVPVAGQESDECF